MRSLIFLAICIAASETCPCIKDGNLEEKFCSSDFVSHAKVLSRSPNLRDPEREQKVVFVVDHLKVYNKRNLMKLPRRVLTAAEEDWCGVDLQIGQEYVLGCQFS
ncbi:unnamed protein product [Strongylus vulgaris]|uniref:NTR domain-containing protein n=1 Tax=Strongylus vulgaris TaxID=40348 RepID=A0A3P7IXX5_STRVU|nr:unnamed protein product [Strongylus vulgaris]